VGWDRALERRGTRKKEGEEEGILRKNMHQKRRAEKPRPLNPKGAPQDSLPVEA